MNFTKAYNIIEKVKKEYKITYGLELLDIDDIKIKDDKLSFLADVSNNVPPMLFVADLNEEFCTLTLELPIDVIQL